MTNATPLTDPRDEHKRVIDHRLEEGAWGIFLILIGVLWLIPDTKVPEELWLVGAGVIMLGLNLVRYFNHIRMHGLTIILGVAAILAGVASSFHVDVPVFALLIIVLGAALLARQLVPRHERHAEAR